MPADYLNRDFKPSHTSFLRMNYYPVCPTPEFPAGLDKPSSGHLGINHHTDAGAVTVLLQDDQAGLEVYRGKQWHLVETRSDALVINIGDIVQVWSNDLYHAPLHRVRANAKAERFSVPFFFNPAYQSDYAPLPTMVDSKQPARYRAINWGKFRALRAGGDYADSAGWTTVEFPQSLAGARRWMFAIALDVNEDGHLDIVERALRIFDEVEVTVAVNAGKRVLLSTDERCDLIRQCTAHFDGVTVAAFEGLLVDYARRRRAAALVRGLRQVSDFDYEFQMAFANRKLYPELETVFLMTSEAHALISSTVVRDVHRWGGDLSPFVPPPVEEALRKK
ncbi:MAG: pantetheine-phosphate adenylyltransferase [Bacteroidetes bacterium]|nr:pantetheine-phosphate adenylyltransferase [Bacteroidota bacterium]